MKWINLIFIFFSRVGQDKVEWIQNHKRDTWMEWLKLNGKECVWVWDLFWWRAVTTHYWTPIPWFMGHPPQANMPLALVLSSLSLYLALSISTHRRRQGTDPFQRLFWYKDKYVPSHYWYYRYVRLSFPHLPFN